MDLLRHRQGSGTPASSRCHCPPSPQEIPSARAKSPASSRTESELRAHAREPAAFILFGKTIDDLEGTRDRAVIDPNRSTAEAPPPSERDSSSRCVAGCPTHNAPRDRSSSTPLARIELVEERARPVVDGLAGDRRVVGVHDPVHEPDQPSQAADEVSRLPQRSRDRSSASARSLS